MKRPWLSSTTVRSGTGWRCTYFDVEGPIVSVWGEDMHAARADAAKHLREHATPKEAGQ